MDEAEEEDKPPAGSKTEKSKTSGKDDEEEEKDEETEPKAKRSHKDNHCKLDLVVHGLVKGLDEALFRQVISFLC